MVPALAEFHHAIGQGEQREVLAHTDILAGMIDRAALTDDDVTSDGGLTTEYLYTKTLTLGVPAVFDAAFPFFVCHIL